MAATIGQCGDVWRPGGVCASLWRYCLAISQLYEHFWRYALINTIPNVIKLAAVVVLVAAGAFTLQRLLALHFLVMVAALPLSLLVIPHICFENFNWRGEAGRELVGFAKWLYVANLLFVLLAQMDILSLTYYSDGESVGIYSAALSLTQALQLIYVSLLMRMLPQVSRAATRDELIEHMKRSIKMSGVLCLPTLALFIVASPLVVLPYGDEFRPAVPLFRIQLFGFLFTLLFNPFLLVLYARRKPQVFSLLYLGLLLLAVPGYAAAIPVYGAMGAAYVMCGVRIVSALVILALAVREVLPPGRPVVA